MISGKIVDGRGHYPYVRHVESGLQKPGDERAADTWRTAAHVSAHHQPLAIPPPEEGADRLSNPCCYSIGQILVSDSPDAEFSKNVWVYIHCTRYFSPVVVNVPDLCLLKQK